MDISKVPSSGPTWRGRVETTKDALLIFEACLNKTLRFCPSRPRGRPTVGNVFVCDEADSGIKRWTDGIPWSPSRICTDFFVYRELNQSSEKKRAQKRSGRPPRPGVPQPGPASSTARPTTDKRLSSSHPTKPMGGEEGHHKTVSRSTVGSLVDSYGFKDNGLLKKTMTVTVNTHRYHLIAYYSINNAEHCLTTPRVDSCLKNLQIRDALLYQSRFALVDLDNTGERNFDHTGGSQHLHSAHRQNAYDQSPMHIAQAHNLYSASRRNVCVSAQPPPAGTSSTAILPSTTAAYCQQQQLGLCSWEFQDQRSGHQLPQHQDQQAECAAPPPWYAIPQYTGPLATWPRGNELWTAPETPGSYDAPYHWAPQVEAVLNTHRQSHTQNYIPIPQPRQSHVARDHGPSWVSSLEASAGIWSAANSPVITFMYPTYRTCT